MVKGTYTFRLIISYIYIRDLFVFNIGLIGAFDKWLFLFSLKLKLQAKSVGKFGFQSGN